MIPKGIFIQGLHILALTPIERWEAARHFFKTASEGNPWLFISAAAVISIFIMFVFWLIDKFRHSRRHHTQARQ